MNNELSASFERLTEIEAKHPTLIEGLPGHGLVASIAVEQIVTQLGLDHYGNIVSDAFPQVASFEDGRIRDLVRVCAGSDPTVMTLQSDVVLSPPASRALSQCVLEDLAPEFDRAVFLAGAPAETEAQIGDVHGIATTDDLERELVEAGIELAEGRGVINGVTGRLATACYHADIPAVVLAVKADPYLPDPTAAQSVIETALEPLVHFNIDTTELKEQADMIQTRLEDVAQQFRRAIQQQHSGQQEDPAMYQ
ncbi:proteasome assembly chaperone family protein [Natronococcus wangiae]|uniref:proteasome assembly chaperone family protein n=1 Tax=Natronococcus wangiae TaxID=3068275 RepID=UPI00273DA067|nr:PAC2 family protein [Natronococcus sp. AD5]